MTSPGKPSFWRQHRDALLVSIIGTTIGTVLAASIVFVASSLGGLIHVSGQEVGKTLAYVGVGLLAVIYVGLNLAERLLQFQIRRAQTMATRARLAADARKWSRDEA